MYLFCYRIANQRGDRDAVAYASPNSKSVHGPCFSVSPGTNTSGWNSTAKYADVETALTENEYNDMVANGVSERTIAALSTPYALDFAEEIFADEAEAMMDEHSLTRSELDDILYRSDYRDCGVISEVTDLDGICDRMEDLLDDVCELPEQWKCYFDFGQMAEDAIYSGDEYVKLSDGRIAVLNI